ncbi:hypothetical protein DK847_13160 [Aestuariivirga litoralis]|uniref:Uncharacterized protein n=1 Tax=Aestuariivirga litoralis TaxID=2650924 RepID=A0A2W2B751_9HYPH|nr:DUF2092 domain-containing protein [Aestuariivirga litoralis]PZF76154.1 hypothetical protein DK847_13160 [Aestuariivirga litoralis]
MRDDLMIGRRGFAGFLAGGAVAAIAGTAGVRAAAPDGAGAVNDTLAALQAAKALSFTADSVFGASVAKDRLKTLGTRASVVFTRPDSLFAVFGGGGEPDVQMLITGGEATLLRLSLAAKTVVKLAPERGAAFMVPGLFIPFLGLLSQDPATDFFGGVNSITPIAQGLPDQPEQTTLDAVMGGRFTGEVWVDRSTSLPARINGTWFSGTGDVAASAAVTFTGWSSEVPPASAFALKGIDAAKAVDIDALGL